MQKSVYAAPAPQEVWEPNLRVNARLFQFTNIATQSDPRQGSSMLWVLTLLVANPHSSGAPQEWQTCCVYCGNGVWKTLTFWMPLLFVPEAIQIVVTPLNILGKKNVETLAKVGIKAISITAETATAENFRVSILSSARNKTTMSIGHCWTNSPH